jgi:uncharacterized membrane protein (UPF0182 family)
MMKRKIPKNVVLIAAAVVVFILLAGTREFFSFLVDWRFFQEVGYEAVFTKTFMAKLLAGLVFGLAAFLMVSVNLFVAGKRKLPPVIANPLWESVPQLQHLDLNRLMNGISLLVSVAAFLLAFPVGTQYWDQALLFLNSVPAGLADPLFGRDISFYLFQYPFFDEMNTLARGLIVIAAILTTAVYLLRGGLMISGKVISADPFMKRHIGVLVSLFLLSLAVRFASTALACSRPNTACCMGHHTPMYMCAW